MKTFLEEPFWAYLLIEYYRADRLSHECFYKCMDDPRLARHIVYHEMMHDLHKVAPHYDTSQMSAAIDARIEATLADAIVPRTTGFTTAEETSDVTPEEKRAAGEMINRRLPDGSLPTPRSWAEIAKDLRNIPVVNTPQEDLQGYLVPKHLVNRLPEVKASRKAWKKYLKHVRKHRK